MKPRQILLITTLLAAGGSLAMSVFIYFSNSSSVDQKLNGIYVGTWVPSILALGAFLVVAQRKTD